MIEDEVQEIQAEIIDAENIIHQAKLKKLEVREEGWIAEEPMSMSAEKWDQGRERMYLSDNEINNPYEVLGVHKKDSLATIKEVYKKLIDIYNPDKHQTADDLSLDQKKELSARINTAYEWLLKYHHLE